jgi:hypothetical protein
LDFILKSESWFDTFSFDGNVKNATDNHDLKNAITSTVNVKIPVVQHFKVLFMGVNYVTRSKLKGST